MKYPDREGVWWSEEHQCEVDVYPLEPVGGILCIWGEDIGFTFTGQGCGTEVWDNDEWQGHIPIGCACLEGEWTFLRHDTYPDASP